MKPFTTIAAAIFVLMAVVHAFRIFVGFPVTIGTKVLGPEVSWAGLVIAAVMAVGLIREAGR